MIKEQTMKRIYRAAMLDQRCKWDRVLPDGSGAQCMRRAMQGGYCKQHAAMAASFPKQGAVK